MSLILVDGIKDRPGTGGPKFPNGLHLPAGIGITGDGHINMAGVCTFSGNVTIGGTLTYEDVTNIDSVGIITANTGINVVANGINVQAGILTAKNIIDASDAQRNTRVGENAGDSFDGTNATDESKFIKLYGASEIIVTDYSSGDNDNLSTIGNTSTNTTVVGNTDGISSIATTDIKVTLTADTTITDSSTTSFTYKTPTGATYDADPGNLTLTDVGHGLVGLNLQLNKCHDVGEEILGLLQVYYFLVLQCKNQLLVQVIVLPLRVLHLEPF